MQKPSQKSSLTFGQSIFRSHKYAASPFGMEFSKSVSCEDCVCVCVWSTTTECKLKMCINNIETRTISERERHTHSMKKAKINFKFSSVQIFAMKNASANKNNVREIYAAFFPLYIWYMYMYMFFFLLLSLRTFLIKSEKPMRWAAAGHRRQWKPPSSSLKFNASGKAEKRKPVWQYWQ